MKICTNARVNQQAQVVVFFGIVKKKSPYNKMLCYYNKKFSQYRKIAFLFFLKTVFHTLKHFVPCCLLKRMAFPVDMLDNCSHEELENSAEDYMSDLRCGDPENPECFSLLNITVRHPAVIFISLFH